MNEKIINQFISYIDKECHFSKNTMRGYKNDLIQYLDFLVESETNLLDCKSKHIQHYLGRIRKNNISNRSMARKLASIKSFYKYMANNKIIPINIARTIKSPKIPKRSNSFF